MDCESFISGYSEYRDGLLTSEDRAVYVSHLASCASCARYDRVVRCGIDIMRSMPPADSSDDFVARLQHRLYHVEDGIPMSAPRFGGSAALVGVAAVGLLALFWLPFAASVPVELQLPAVAVETPPAVGEVPPLFQRGPFLAADYGGLYVPPLLGGQTDWPPREHVHPTILLGSVPSASEGTSRR